MAREKGAIAYVSEIPYPQAGLPGILVCDMRRTIAPWPTSSMTTPPGG